MGQSDMQSTPTNVKAKCLHVKRGFSPSLKIPPVTFAY
jgi:hypothetical protein